jgi:hypothetical protein
VVLLVTDDALILAKRVGKSTGSQPGLAQDMLENKNGKWLNLVVSSRKRHQAPRLRLRQTRVKRCQPRPAVRGMLCKEPFPALRRDDGKVSRN